MWTSKKLTCKGTLRQVLICMRSPLLLGFCLLWSSNFVGSESSQIQSVKLLQNMVFNRTPHAPPPPSHTLYMLYFEQGRGEESWTRERGKGKQFTKLGRLDNANMTECISSISRRVDTVIYCTVWQTTFFLSFNFRIFSHILYEETFSHVWLCTDRFRTFYYSRKILPNFFNNVVFPCNVASFCKYVQMLPSPIRRGSKDKSMLFGI
jgi:hypothetical protein